MLRSLGDRRGLRFGTTTNLSDPWQHPHFNDRLREFHVLATIHYSILNAGREFPGVFPDGSSGSAYDYFVPLTRAFDMRYRLYNLFWNLDVPDTLWDGAPERGNSPSPEYRDKVIQHMEDRIHTVLTEFPATTELGFANEAFFEYQGRTGFADSPYLRVFGPSWIADAYLMTYRIARELGRRPGDDLTLFYGDYNYEVPGIKADLVYRQLVALKQRAAAELDIDDPPIVVDMQLHVDFDEPAGAGQLSAVELSRERLAANCARFREIGPVYIGEFSIHGGTRAQRTETVLAVVQASLDAGVDSIVFWELMSPNGLYAAGDLLFDAQRNLEPTETYDALIALLQGA